MKDVHAVVILLLLTLTACTKVDNGGTEDHKRSVLVFADVGAEIDDQWMLVHLLGMEQIEIKAVFSSHHGGLTGPDEAEQSKEIIDDIRSMTGNDHVPSFSGSNRRLRNRDDVNHTTADILHDLLQGYSEENKATLVMSGPATDVAGALITYPSIADKIEICATAFYSRELGTSYNVHNDPIAWQILLEHDIPITVSPNDVSKNSFLLTREEMLAITDVDTEISRYLSEGYIEWITENEEIVTRITGDKDTWPIWDQILSAYVLGYCRTEETARPVLLDNGYLNYWATEEHSTMQWIIECDSSLVWEEFRTILGDSSARHN